MNNELVNGQRQVGVLYGFAEDTILQAIGLTTADAYKSESGIRYYTSDKLNKAMSDALTANATTVKNALELPSEMAARPCLRRMKMDTARSADWSRGCIWWWRPVCLRMSPAPAIPSL